MLDELEMEPLPLEDIITIQGDQINEYHRYIVALSQEKKPMNWTFGDFLCNKYLIERENPMKAALESSKMLNSICQGQIGWHPFTLMFKKLVGIDGYQEPNVATCAYVGSLKDDLDKQLQIGAGQSLYFQQVVEFLKKSFKNVSN